MPTVGASLLAKRPARALSPASRLLQSPSDIPADRRSQLAGEEARKSAFAGKPAPAQGNQPTTK
ncbi:hypothetical protein FCI59_08530 [Pseudomonas protegens]|nr:hypothetical protein [Pseudomonas protegens]